MQPSFEDMAKEYLKSLGYTVAKSEGRSFTDFVQAIRDSKPPMWEGSADPARKYSQQEARNVLAKRYSSQFVEKAAMAENQGSTGGYTVPLDFTYRMLEVISEESFVYPRADVVPMDSAEMNVPMFDPSTAQSAGVPPYYGGVSLKWGSEQAPLESEPTFRSISLKAWDLLGFSRMSNQYLMDTGPRGEEYLVRMFGRAAAYAAEYAFLQGQGANLQMPLGVVSAPATLQVIRQTAAQIQIKDISGMTAKLLPYSWKNAIWATGPDCLNQIQQIGSYFINIELGDWAHHSRPKPAGMLSTLPLFITDKLPPLGAPGDLVLFDPSLYVIGERMQVVVDVSPHSRFQNFQTEFRIWMRLDGKPRLPGPVTLTDGGRTASPFVALK